MSDMIGNRLTRQDAVRRGKGEIKDYQDAGISSLEMVPMYLTGTADAVNDSLSISRGTANKFNFTDDDRTEDTLRHILLGGLAAVGEEDSVFGAKNFLGTGLGSKVASSLIDAREGSKENRSAESEIDLNNNAFGRALRKAYPNREEFIQKAIDISNAMYAGDTPENIDDLSPMLSYGATPVPQKAEGGIMMAQQGKMPLPMEEATSAPQGGGPKAANPAAQPAGLGAPTGAPAPAGSSDPRDEAIKEVAQKMQSRSAPAPIPAEVPQMATPVPPTGLATPMGEIPMMAKGGMTDEGGMSVMIGLGAPNDDYEEAAEGNPPPGATKEEVADDQLVLLSEGELVVPANVVRYHGLGTYEGMRRDALMGLQDMETNGQIEYVSGGDEKADKVDDNGGIIKANRGTFIQPPSTYTQNPVIPQAASSQYVQVPGTQGMNPAVRTAVNPVTGLAMPASTALQPLALPGVPTLGQPYQPVTTASSVFAPNTGSYTDSQDGTDDTTDDTTDDGTVPDETEEERRRRLAAQNTGDGGGNDNDTTPGATTVFGGESVDGRIRGGKTYEIGYTSSSAKPGIGLGNMFNTLTNIDQVTLTDPQTGQSVNMSKAKYDEMKKDRTNAANVNFIDTLMQNQAGIDYNRTRAGAIAPFKTGLAVAGETFGFGKAPGTSIFEQNEYARSLAGSLGIDYNGQSFAEIMASPEANAPKPGGPSPVFTQDAQGNLVPDTRFSTPPGVQAPSTQSVFQGPMGLGIPDELLSYPSGMNSMAAIQNNNLSTPTSITDPVTGMVSIAPSALAGKQSVPGIANIAGTVMTVIDPVTGAVSSQPMPQMSTVNTAAMTPAQRSTASEIIDRQMQAAGLTSAPSEQVGVSTSPTLEGVSQTGDYRSQEVGRSTSPTLEGVSQTGNYGIEAGDFDTPDNQGANMDDDAPSASRDMSTKEGRKADADERAQEQTGNPNSTAVTDKDGNPVTSTNPDGSESVVTNTPPSSNDSGSDDGCFAKGTLINMADGTTKPVEDVDISDEVELGGFVFATGKFLINNLYEYKDIQVSGSHMVLEDGVWLRVEDSELSKLITKDDTIVYVFGSENRRIVIDDVVFTDYFEVNEQEKLKQIGDSYFTNWKKDAKITSKSNLEVRNTANANATTLAA